MNESEKSVYEYLTSQGLGAVVYEPDGKVPPDFLVSGRIAVEVRRLNQNEETADGHRGLEETSKPLHALVCKALADVGPPVAGTAGLSSTPTAARSPPRKSSRRYFATPWTNVDTGQSWESTRFVSGTECVSGLLARARCIPNSLFLADRRTTTLAASWFPRLPRISVSASPRRAPR